MPGDNVLYSSVEFAERCHLAASSLPIYIRQNRIQYVKKGKNWKELWFSQKNIDDFLQYQAEGEIKRTQKGISASKDVLEKGPKTMRTLTAQQQWSRMNEELFRCMKNYKLPLEIPLSHELLLKTETMQIWKFQFTLCPLLVLVVPGDDTITVISEELLAILEDRLEKKEKECSDLKQKQVLLEKGRKERVITDYVEKFTVYVEATPHGYRMTGKDVPLNKVSGEGTTEEEAYRWFRRDFMGHLFYGERHQNESNFTKEDRDMFETLSLLYVDVKSFEKVK
jgi:hypothetical protein